MNKTTIKKWLKNIGENPHNLLNNFHWIYRLDDLCHIQRNG